MGSKAETCVDDRLYARLLRYVRDREVGFCLVFVSVRHQQEQRNWRRRLREDLTREGIGWVELCGEELLSGRQGQGLIEPISPRIPAGAWVLSLAELEQGHSAETETAAGLPGAGHARTPPPLPLIARLNMERNQLMARCPVPVVVWVTSEWAPDFYDLRRTVLELPLPRPPVRQLLPDLPPPMHGPDPEAAHTRVSKASLEREAERLRFLGDERDAEQGRRFIRLLPELAAKDPEQGHPALAQSLNNHGLLLAAGGRRQEAEATYREALAIHRELAGWDPQAFRADLAPEQLGPFRLHAQQSSWLTSWEKGWLLDGDRPVLGRALDARDLVIRGAEAMVERSADPRRPALMINQRPVSVATRALRRAAHGG
jgi:hypothetical protein